ncbi:uncharacterized protein HaLaN_29134, partial [Haematococcus lacustris]
MGAGTSRTGAAPAGANQSTDAAVSPDSAAQSDKGCRWFGEYVEQSWSTRQVVNDIIKVQTAQERCCYLDLLEPVEVGAPLLYIIHTWDRPFHKMIKVLSKGLALAYPDLPEEQMFVWIDVFAVRQWGPALGPDDLLNLRTAISSCQGAVLCLDTAAAALTRSW